MTKPIARHDYPPEKFPLTLQLYSGKTGELVWSRTVTINEARTLAKIEIPSYAGTEHWPVWSTITYADGTPGPAAPGKRLLFWDELAGELQPLLDLLNPRSASRTSAPQPERSMKLKTIDISLDELNLISELVARDRDQCLDGDGHMRLLTDEDEQRAPLHQSILKKLEEACAPTEGTSR